MEPHLESGHTHWEYGDRLDITDEDISLIPESSNFSMTLAQNGHTAYIADPIAQHILIIDLALMQNIGDIELDYIPSMITWLGVAQTSNP